MCVYVRAHRAPFFWFNCIKLRMCVSQECVCACASRIIGALFSLLSVLVFTRRSYPMRPHRRSKPRSAPGRSLFSPTGGRVAVLRDSDEAGEREFVKRITIKCADMAGTSPVLSDHSGKRLLVCQLVVLTDEVSFICELPLLTVVAGRRLLALHHRQTGWQQTFWNHLHVRIVKL